MKKTKENPDMQKRTNVRHC